MIPLMVEDKRRVKQPQKTRRGKGFVFPAEQHSALGLGHSAL